MWFGDGKGDVRLAKLVLPPVQVFWGAPGRGVRVERTIVERGEHGLQAGEMSTSCRDDQCCM